MMSYQLKYGLTYDFRNPIPWQRPWNDLYEDLLKQIEIAEELGFDQIWLTEHHFAEDGYLPSLFPVAAAIASRTQSLRIGTNALLAALHHPLRVAEDAAIVDILSNGRLDIGLTLGFRKIEFDHYGLDATLGGRIERLKRVVQALQQAYSGLDCDPPVCPPPIQKPHPPIYVGANTTRTLKALAPLGVPLLLIGSQDKLMEYQTAQIASGLDPSSIGAPVQSLGMFLYVAENRETAWETVKPHVRYVVEQDRIWAGKSAAVSDDELKRFGLVGDPEDIAEGIVQRVRDTRPQQVCFFANPPGMNPERVIDSLRLFATRVRNLVEARLHHIMS